MLCVDGRVRETTRDAQLALVCANEHIRLTMLPELGARVIELHDLRRGREWLAAPDGWRHRQAAFGAAAQDFIAGGWDECFPSIAPGVHPGPAYAGTPLADHGELWSRPWCWHRVDGGIRTTIEGVRFPYMFTRQICLAGERVVVDYEITNAGPEALVAMWSMHPVFAVSPGMRVLLADVESVTVDFCSDPGRLSPSPDPVSWPPRRSLGARGDLASIRAAEEALAAKLYTHRLASGRAALHDPRTGDWLALSFDTSVAAYLGIWINEGGWPPERPLYHVAFEPASGCSDQLDVAARAGSCLRLAAGERRAWRVTLTLGRGLGTLDVAADEAHAAA